MSYYLWISYFWDETLSSLVTLADARQRRLRIRIRVYVFGSDEMIEQLWDEICPRRVLKLLSRALISEKMGKYDVARVEYEKGASQRAVDVRRLTIIDKGGVVLLLE